MLKAVMTPLKQCEKSKNSHKFLMLITPGKWYTILKNKNKTSLSFRQYLLKICQYSSWGHFVHAHFNEPVCTLFRIYNKIYVWPENFMSNYT